MQNLFHMLLLDMRPSNWAYMPYMPNICWHHMECMHIYMPHEVNVTNHASWSTLHIFEIKQWKIGLPHCKCSLSQPKCYAGIQTQHFCTCIQKNKANCNIYFTCYCLIGHKEICPPNWPYMPIFYRHTWRCFSIDMPHKKSVASTMWPWVLYTATAAFRLYRVTGRNPNI